MADECITSKSIHKVMQSCYPVSGPTKHLKLTRQLGFLGGRGGGTGKSKQKENGVVKLVVQAAKCIMEGGDWAQDYQKIRY